MTFSKFTLFGLTISLLVCCGQGHIETPKNAMDKFESFRQKEKFIEDTVVFYPGISNPTLRPTLTEKINMAADDFKAVAKSGHATDRVYQEKIRVGLQRFADLYVDLDTEDRERVCLYFQELMDIVGLKSSDGQLNEFMYGFDPSKK